MDYHPPVRSVLDALDKANVPYMIVGALSANVYGVMRATNDATLSSSFRAGACPK
jgi:hypothetical protein